MRHQSYPTHGSVYQPPLLLTVTSYVLIQWDTNHIPTMALFTSLHHIFSGNSNWTLVKSQWQLHCHHYNWCDYADQSRTESATSAGNAEVVLRISYGLSDFADDWRFIRRITELWSCVKSVLMMSSGRDWELPLSFMEKWFLKSKLNRRIMMLFIKMNLFRLFLTCIGYWVSVK